MSRTPLPFRRWGSGAVSQSSDREARSASARPSTPPPATVAVLLPLPLDRAYDYAVPEELAADIAPGSFVRVPLGRVERIGVVWGEGEGDVEPARLKPVTAVLESPPMTEPLRRLIDWAADYTLAQRGAVLRMAMSVPAAVEPPPMRTAYRRGQDEAPRMTEARQSRARAFAGRAAAHCRRDRAQSQCGNRRGAWPGCPRHGRGGLGARGLCLWPPRYAPCRPDLVRCASRRR